MDMLDYRMHHAIMAAEERVDSLRRERTQQRLFCQDRPLPAPRPTGRRRWSIAAFFGRPAPRGDATVELRLKAGGIE
jgi:hypothetical protein